MGPLGALFTQVCGRVILRTSPKRRSGKFALGGAVCTPSLYLPLGVDSRAPASVQWWRGLPDFGGRGPDKRQPHRPPMEGPHLRCQQARLLRPHLRLEAEDETLEVGGSDVEGLRHALGKALEAREAEEIRTADGELDYYTIQRVRHVLLSGGVRLGRPRTWKEAGE